MLMPPFYSAVAVDRSDEGMVEWCVSDDEIESQPTRHITCRFSPSLFLSNETRTMRDVPEFDASRPRQIGRLGSVLGLVNSPQEKRSSY